MAKHKKAKPRPKHKPPKMPEGMGKGKARRDGREELFILEYLKDQNAARAARAAGYSEVADRQIGYRLLTKAYIKQRILNALAEQKARVKLEADEILLGIKHLAVSDPRRIFNLETGEVLPPAEWPDDVAQAVAGFEVKETFHPLTGQHTGYIKKVKFWDKPKSQENLGRNQGLFKDVVEGNHTAQVSVVDEAEVKKIREKIKSDC